MDWILKNDVGIFFLLGIVIGIAHTIALRVHKWSRNRILIPRRFRSYPKDLYKTADLGLSHLDKEFFFYKRVKGKLEVWGTNNKDRSDSTFICEVLESDFKY